MDSKNKIKILLALATAFIIYFCYVLVMISDKGLWTFQTLLNCSIALLFGFCLKGLWRRNKTALILSYFLMTVAFGYGVYFVHFAWTFWIFNEPTIQERILNVLHPRVSVMVIFPIMWAICFSIKKLREEFK